MALLKGRLLILEVSNTCGSAVVWGSATSPGPESDEERYSTRS